MLVKMSLGPLWCCFQLQDAGELRADASPWLTY
jgi:hypothetical protein